jgi:hypothetical protein
MNLQDQGTPNIVFQQVDQQMQLVVDLLLEYIKMHRPGNIKFANIVYLLFIHNSTINTTCDNPLASTLCRNRLAQL